MSQVFLFLTISVRKINDAQMPLLTNKGVEDASEDWLKYSCNRDVGRKEKT